MNEALEVQVTGLTRNLQIWARSSISYAEIEPRGRNLLGQKIKKIFRERGGFGGAAASQRGHPSPLFQAARCPSSPQGDIYSNKYPGWNFDKVSPASSAKVRIFNFMECPPPLQWERLPKQCPTHSRRPRKSKRRPRSPPKSSKWRRL